MPAMMGGGPPPPLPRSTVARRTPQPCQAYGGRDREEGGMIERKMKQFFYTQRCRLLLEIRFLGSTNMVGPTTIFTLFTNGEWGVS
jgi:hypothetical protein